jgi:beta-N-acetylhexosaminidase
MKTAGLKKALLLSLFFATAFAAAGQSLEQKIGGLLMVGFRGMSAEADSPVVRDICEYNLGGVIFFDADLQLKTGERNIHSPIQLAQLTGALQSYAKGSLLIAIDQEGGLVNRLKPAYGFPPTLSQQQLGQHDDPDFTARQTAQLAGALKTAGINLNLAPVVDLAVNPENFIVKKERTFSADPGKTIRHTAASIRAHHDQGVLCTLKHFPGHGSSAADSHLDMTDVTGTWQASELEPYRQLCSKADVVMTAHIFQRNLDPDWPATLSKRIITDLLRNEIGYQGVVMTDDLGMKAIASHYGFETALEYSLNAGADILLIANNETYDPDLVPKTVQIIAGLVRTGRVPESRIDEALRRITQLKSKVSVVCQSMHGSVMDCP